MAKREYLGDGVYVKMEDYGDILLYTDNGITVDNRIVLEWPVYNALVKFADKARKEVKEDG